MTTDSIPVSSITKIKKLNKTRKVSVTNACILRWWWRENNRIVVVAVVVVERNKKLRRGEIIEVGVGWEGGAGCVSCYKVLVFLCPQKVSEPELKQFVFHKGQ